MFSQLLHLQLSLPVSLLRELAVQCISLDPAPDPCFSFPQTLLLLLHPYLKNIAITFLFSPWTDTVFSMLPPSLLPALRVAIFRPRKLASVDPAACPQPPGDLCTLLSVSAARSRHTWPARSRCGLGRIYFPRCKVPQVLSCWRSATSAERSGTALPGCVASPGCFDFFGMSPLLLCVWARGFLMSQKNHLCFLTSQSQGS